MTKRSKEILKINENSDLSKLVLEGYNRDNSFVDELVRMYYNTILRYRDNADELEIHNSLMSTLEEYSTSEDGSHEFTEYISESIRLMAKDFTGTWEKLKELHDNHSQLFNVDVAIDIGWEDLEKINENLTKEELIDFFNGWTKYSNLSEKCANWVFSQDDLDGDAWIDDFMDEFVY